MLFGAVSSEAFVCATHCGRASLSSRHSVLIPPMPAFIYSACLCSCKSFLTNHMTFHVCFCPWDHNTHGSMESLPSWMKCLESNILVETCMDAHNSLLSGACHHLLLRHLLLSHLVCSMCGPTLLPRKAAMECFKKLFSACKKHRKRYYPSSLDIFLILNRDWWQANLNKLPHFFRVHS